MTGQSWFRFPNGGRNPRATGEGPTLPKSFRAAGYETWYAEKSGSANLPTIRRQFDSYRDTHMVNNLLTGYAARSQVDQAIDFVTTRQAEKPFFIYLGTPCPRDPRISAPEFRNMYDWQKIPPPPNYLPIHPFENGEMTIRDEMLELWPRTRRAIQHHLRDYYALITCMDRDLGRLFDTLERTGQWKNTIVVYSSDQGLAVGSHGLMGKQNVYEDTMKVPLIVRGPGIKKGETDALAYLIDVLPTLCELTGGKAPMGIDGRSLAPVITGRSEGVRDQLMLAYKNVQRSIRDERWKLIRYPKVDRTQLFDLANDPHETRDLADDPEYADQVDRLMKLLAAEQQAFGDPDPLVIDEPVDGTVTAEELTARAARSLQGYMRTLKSWERACAFGADFVPTPGKYKE